jgi:hypothetical protein
MEDNIKNLDKNLSKLGKVKLETVNKIESAINEIVEITEQDPRYSKFKQEALDLKKKFEKIASEIVYENPSGGRSKTRRFKKKRLMSKAYCKKTPCRRMGFTQKASCRPYKNCY